MRRPRVTSVEEPSGATSHRRTATSARGRSAARVTDTSGNPSSSTRVASGPDVNESARASSARWSVGKSTGPPYGHQTPESSPAVCTPTISAGPSSPGKGSVRSSFRGGGHEGSAIQRPGRSR